eukprot:scaffold105263_cov35-Prasinocladus_malaysianus.AAC.1
MANNKSISLYTARKGKLIEAYMSRRSSAAASFSTNIAGLSCPLRLLAYDNRANIPLAFGHYLGC